MLLPLLVEARSDRAMRFAFCRNIISIGVDVIYNDASKVERSFECWAGYACGGTNEY